MRLSGWRIGLLRTRPRRGRQVDSDVNLGHLLWAGSSRAALYAIDHHGGRFGRLGVRTMVGEGACTRSLPRRHGLAHDTPYRPCLAGSGRSHERPILRAIVDGILPEL
jgi:hypothetical protein